MTENTRKYITEWTIGITVFAAAVGRQQEFQKTGVPHTDDPCHLYFVTLLPRMSIDPSSVTITDNEVSGVLRIQHGPAWSEFPFRSPHSLGRGPLRWSAEWPYEEFAIQDAAGRRVAGGVVAHLHVYIHDWPEEAMKHRIVYVGQAFGRVGERTAWDRLKRHETVQRILAETPPDQQVWLTLAAITDLNLFPEIDARKPTTKTSEEDDIHNATIIKAIDEDSFQEREAVALAEAGLIRFFEPKYNDRMKYKFPARKQIPLKSIRKLDFHGLIVELQTDGVGALYGSDVQPFSYLHFAGFMVHEDPKRAGTMTLEATDVRPPLAGL